VNEHVRAPKAGLSRRGFLAGTGLTFAITLAPGLFAKAGGALAAQGDQEIGAWVNIRTDGGIVISSPAAEMGQGSMTGLLMVFAEEMDADWSKVSARPVPANGAVYGNASGVLTTVGSNGIRGHFDKMRMQGAAVRRVLMQAAADKWEVPLAEVATEPGVVVHAAAGQRLTYGEIASFAAVPAAMPKVDKAELKKPADYRIIGKVLPRLDVPAKTDGSAVYGIDVQIPGMVYATILRSPVEGTVPKVVQDEAAKAIPGVERVIRLRNAVGVVGSSVEAVFAGREALKVEWNRNDYSGYDSEEALDEFLDDARNPDKKGVPFVAIGDAEQSFDGEVSRITADYTTDYVYHAGMEPINVTAMVNPDGGAEIWMGTQSQSAIQATAAAFLKVKPEQVKVNQHFLGGGFGRRSAADMVPDALMLSKELKRPVKLIWTREQDIKAAKLRPMTAHHLEAAIDPSGRVISWKHKIVAESVLAYGSPARLEQSKGLDGIVLSGARIDYDVPNQATSYLREIRGTALSAWRGIGAGYNKYVIDAFMDEIAASQNADPVEFRLKHLRDERARNVLRTVAEMAGWGAKPAEGRAVGVGFGLNVASWTAGIAEISLDRGTGEIRVHKVWAAIDQGIAINPDMVVSQTEGCIIYGLSAALRERVTLTDGVVDQDNLFDYRVARMSDVPDIEVKVIVTDNPPTGIGEAALPLIAPAIANAFYALTGKRLRSLPFSPARVKAALGETGV
jgi:isoquinoline 1-oxidoreductase beta subunit